MKDFEQPNKPEVVRFLLEQEGRVMLCLDATHEGVEVPRRFRSDQGLRLVLNSQMPQPIEIMSDAIRSELRFGGVPHLCVVPYESLWGAFNPDTGHGMLWSESMPEVIRRSYSFFSQSQSEEELLEEDQEQTPRRRQNDKSPPENVSGFPQMVPQMAPVMPSPSVVQTKNPFTPHSADGAEAQADGNRPSGKGKKGSAARKKEKIKRGFQVIEGGQEDDPPTETPPAGGKKSPSPKGKKRKKPSLRLVE